MFHNPIRGEVVASIGSLKVTLVITMDGLAQLGAATGYPSLMELWRRFSGTEPMTVLTAIELFTVGGEVDGKKLGREEAISQAKARITLEDFNALQDPLTGLLGSLLKKSDGAQPPGNAESAQNGWMPS